MAFRLQQQLDNISEEEATVALIRQTVAKKVVDLMQEHGLEPDDIIQLGRDIERAVDARTTNVWQS